MTNKNKLDALKAELKNLKTRKKSERTDDENLRIAELEISVKKENAKLLKNKIAKAKDESFLRILRANKIETEQELKDVFLMRDKLRENGIFSSDDVDDHFAEYSALSAQQS